jgi:predicted TIM-barrel fold metal-dependent hydrolase
MISYAETVQTLIEQIRRAEAAERKVEELQNELRLVNAQLNEHKSNCKMGQ